MPKDHPYNFRVNIGVDVIAESYYDAVLIARKNLRDWDPEASVIIEVKPYDEETGVALLFGPRTVYKIEDIDP